MRPMTDRAVARSASKSTECEFPCRSVLFQQSGIFDHSAVKVSSEPLKHCIENPIQCLPRKFVVGSFHDANRVGAPGLAQRFKCALEILERKGSDALIRKAKFCQDMCQSIRAIRKRHPVVCSQDS